MIRLKEKFFELYGFIRSTFAFRERYKGIDKKLFSNNLTRDQIKKYKKKWSVFGYPVEIKTLKLCFNLSGVYDINIVPENMFSGLIEPKINKYKGKELSFFSVKNFYNKWHDKNKFFPKCYLHKIDGCYYDNDNTIVSDYELYLQEQENEIVFPIICKPSLNTAGGEGVKQVDTIESLKEYIVKYDNLVVQEKIKPSSFFESIHEGISSVRVCLYRSNNSFVVLNTSVRFGVNGSLDNASAGGIACNIDSKGFLKKYALDKFCNKFISHPNSNIDFFELEIPFYQELIHSSMQIANNIPLCSLVSLDMCLDDTNKWRCIEVNLKSQTIRFAQYAGVGFFGEYTDEVIKRVLL